MTICAACGYPMMGLGLCAYCLPVQALRYEPVLRALVTTPTPVTAVS